MRISRLFPLLSAMLLLTAPASKAGKTAQTGRSALACPTCCKTCCTPELSKLPREVFSGVRGPFHVQGIAVDLKNGYMYFSFTTELLKTDLQGKLIGSVTGMTGHLGCLTVNPEDGRVYGSLEYKNDEIGRGILRQLNKEGNGENPSDAFYVAIFDVDKITRPDMDAETDGVMTAVYLKEVVDDYYGTAVNGGREVKHRLGCSGIDGISFGPAFGAPKGSKPYLNVAYGIYGDTTRSDNDYQVILNYDPETWKQYEQTLTQQAPHRSGPAAPDHKYFVRTGNTSYGIQNLAYDCASGNWYAAVYRGKKSQYPNYSLFVIDGSKAPRKETLAGFDTPVEGEVLSLVQEGENDPASGIRGWQFEWGTTGLCPIGGGYFYISHQDGGPGGKLQSSTVHLYQWTGDSKEPFRLVE